MNVPNVIISQQQKGVLKDTQDPNMMVSKALAHGVTTKHIIFGKAYKSSSFGTEAIQMPDLQLYIKHQI